MPAPLPSVLKGVSEMRLAIDTNNPDHYETFLRIKALPKFRFQGRTAIFPDEYAALVGMGAELGTSTDYQPWPGLFDYQAGCADLMIRKRKFCMFARCGLGKTLVQGECARHAADVLPGAKQSLGGPTTTKIKKYLAKVGEATTAQIRRDLQLKESAGKLTRLLEHTSGIHARVDGRTYFSLTAKAESEAA